MFYNKIELKSCKIIQKNFLKYLYINSIIKSKYQNKIWRKSQNWYYNGKSNECEKFQKKKIELITNNIIEKTNLRLNFENYKLIKITQPNKYKNGFEYTENFDGFQQQKNNKLYYNLKMIIGTGGAQNRSLRDVYHFIKIQLEFLNLLKQDKNIYFINILDGDESYKKKDKFNYLLNKEKYKDVKKYIFINDLHKFQSWFNKFNK